jgi:phosphoglycolate phosphatase
LKYSYVLWDWNGTLLDDLHGVFSALTSTLSEYGLPTFTLDQYRATVHHPMHSWLAEEGVLKHDQVDLFSRLSDRFHEYYLEERPKYRLHRGAQDLVQRIHAAGIPQAILSAHPQAMLESGVESFGLAPYFAGIFGAQDNGGHGKHDVAQRLIRELNIDCRTALLIGDMDHDFEVAQTVGLTCYLVGNGLQAPTKLKPLGVPVFSSLDDIARQFFPPAS